MQSIRIALILLALASSLPAEAQRNLYTQFFPYCWQLINPASVEPGLFSGRGEDRPQQMASIGVRGQWIGAENAPRTVFAAFENSNKNQPFRIGGFMVHDEAGAFKTTAGYVNYTYFIQLKKRQFLHLGVSIGGISTTLDKSALTWEDPDDPMIQALPPNQGMVDVGIGALYRFVFGPRSNKAQHNNYGYIGLSVPGLAPSGFPLRSTDILKKMRFSNVYLLAGARIEPSDYDYRIAWEPFVWIRFTPPGVVLYTANANGLLVSADLHIRGYLNPRSGVPLWFGCGYGTNRLLRVEAGWQGEPRQAAKQRLRIGVGYSTPVGISALNFGPSFELTSAYILR